MGLYFALILWLFIHRSHLLSFNECHSEVYEHVLRNQCSLSPQSLWAMHMKKIGEHGTPITNEIEEFEYMFNGKNFYESFARKRLPVVFRGVTADWMATRQWKNESYLLEKYADVLFDVEMGKLFEDEFNPRKTMVLRDFLQNYRNTSMYLDSPFPQSSMINDLYLPLMMDCETLKYNFKSMHLLFSNGSTSSPLHNDGYENFLSVFSGTKVVYSIHPRYIKHLYFTTAANSFPGVSPVNPEGIDLVNYPGFVSAPFHKTVLRAGDMLYIPRGWFHQVRSYDSPNIGASLWFNLFTRSYAPNVEIPAFTLRDAIGQEMYINKLVENSPPTIHCRLQNVPMRNFHKIVFPITNVPRGGTLGRNRVFRVKMKPLIILHEEVRKDEPTIFVGSDDSYIYAVSLLTGKVKWKVKTKKDTGSTCSFGVSRLVVYCGADDGNMRALNISNGSLIWKFRTKNSVISSPLVGPEGRIYFGSLDRYFFALRSNGSVFWKTNLKDFVWSSPCSAGETIYISTMSDYHYNIFALNMNTGKKRWRYIASGAIKSSPKLSHDNSTVFFCDMKGYVYALNAVTGEEIFNLRLTNETGIEASPAISHTGVLYIVTNHGDLIALDTVTETVRWKMHIGNSTTRGCTSSPYLGPNGVLYVGAGNGTLLALNPDDQSVIWTVNMKSEIFYSSPRSGENLVVIGTIDGSLHALDAKTGQHAWRIKTGNAIAGTPLIL